MFELKPSILWTNLFLTQFVLLISPLGLFNRVSSSTWPAPEISSKAGPTQGKVLKLFSSKAAVIIRRPFDATGVFVSLVSDCPSFIKEKDHIQDPYSFRCIPQVHGASNDSWTHVQEVFLNEADAVTDNPTVFLDEVIKKSS